MSFLDDEFDIAGAPDNPFDMEDGTYRGKVHAFEKVEGIRNSDKSPYQGLQATLKREDGEDFDYYMPLPTENTAPRTAKIFLSKIKQFLAGCGVPAERMNTVEAEEIIDTPVIFKITTSKPNAQGKTFRNVDVQRDTSEDPEDPWADLSE